ncbi:MAG: hypothetical protein WA814_05685 [Candidatus Baltobacteraceae bacterium]
MPTAQPDIFALIQGAVNDAWSVMRSRMSVYAILAAVCAVAGLAVPLAHLAGPDNEPIYRAQLAIQPANICAAIAIFFAIPAVARTVQPEFRMTFIRLLAIIGIGFVIGLATELGLFLLIAPGIWIGIKLSQTVWCYLLSEGKSPFEESWQITTGHFWETFGFNILIGLIVGIIVVALFLLPVLVAFWIPVLAVIMSPIAFLGYLFAYHISLLGQMRWMLELRKLPMPPAAAPVTPA